MCIVVKLLFSEALKNVFKPLRLQLISPSVRVNLNVEKQMTDLPFSLSSKNTRLFNTFFGIVNVIIDGATYSDPFG